MTETAEIRGKTLASSGGILGSIDQPSNNSGLQAPLTESQLKCCPNCGCKDIDRDGLRYLKDDSSKQRWLCKKCDYRFSERASTITAKIKPNYLTSGGAINTASILILNRQVCAEAKNLTVTETKTVAGESQEQQSCKGKIIEYGFWLQKEGFAEATISRRIRLFETMSKRGANLLDPESVKENIARQKTWSLKTKVLAVDGYTNFLKMLGRTWQPPHYRPIRKLPYIPTEQELNDLIASCNKKTATFLQVLKETGARCGEAWQLKWIDLNSESRTLSITPEKGSEPRQLKISNKLLSMLNSLPNDEPVIFKGTMKSFIRGFRRQRKKTTIKLKSDRIAKITFHTFRHWKATMEYHDTKDILHVMKMLGHRNIQNTLLYTQLVSFENDHYHSATARSVEDVQKLVESGFEFVCDVNDVKVFRKPK